MKISKAKSGRKIPGIKEYWLPKRLTKNYPPIYAWLWWNISMGDKK